MIRRALAGFLTAALLVLAPTVALATPYPPPTPGAVVSTPNPVCGETVTVVVTAPDGAEVSLDVTGPSGYHEVVDETAVDGEARVDVTFSVEGVHTIAVGVDGTVTETLSVTVGQGEPGACEPDGDGAAAPGLPETGATATPLIIGGIVLLLLGGVILYLVRRRTSS